MVKYFSIFISLILMSTAVEAANQAITQVPPENTAIKPRMVNVSYGDPRINIIEEAEEPSYSSHSEAPLFSPLVWAQLGVGVSHMSYAQSIPNYFHLGVNNDQGPTWSGRVGGWLHAQWGLQAEYRSIPAEIKSSRTMQMLNGDFHIERIGMELLYRAHPATVDQVWDCALKLGIHQHDFPLLVPVNNVILSRQLNSVRSLSVGVSSHKRIAEQWRVEGSARYLHPLTAQSDPGALFELTPHFSADAVFGILYRTLNYKSIGLYAMAEWYDYAYNYSGGQYNATIHGYQNIFLTTLELRMGVEF